MKFATTPLSSQHNKQDFCCGKEMLDSYLHRQAGQDMKRHLAACFVLEDEGKNVLGYYTLSSSSIPKNHIPLDWQKKYPATYENLPSTLLGRLAVDHNHFGKGLGATLLMDAMKRSLEASRSQIGSMALIVDPIDESALKFYHKYGFILIPDSGKMFLPMKTIAPLFRD
ncbi:MAG: GNAT family N-acetyltransferase [Bacteroidia bacterium]|nr:GNAT family N-acetyltransferase [Bacteroidia bacterium]